MGAFRSSILAIAILCFCPPEDVYKRQNLDFDDGELKTNKCDNAGNPKETVFITQISSVIDELIQERPFEETHLYEKISNILYVPVCKDGSPKDWMFLPSIHIDLRSPRYAQLRDIWRSDYYSICRCV